jgi:hypothetical protein
MPQIALSMFFGRGDKQEWDGKTQSDTDIFFGCKRVTKPPEPTAPRSNVLAPPLIVKPGKANDTPYKVTRFNK